MRTIGRFTAAAVALAGVATAWSTAAPEPPGARNPDPTDPEESIGAFHQTVYREVADPVKAAQCAGAPPSTGGV
jgi:hypothetical protein